MQAHQLTYILATHVLPSTQHAATLKCRYNTLAAHRAAHCGYDDGGGNIVACVQALKTAIKSLSHCYNPITKTNRTPRFF